MGAYDTAVLADNPAVYLKMDETTGNYLDSSPNTRHFYPVAGTRGVAPGTLSGSAVPYDSTAAAAGAGNSNVVARRDDVLGINVQSMSWDGWVTIPTGSGFRGGFVSIGSTNGITFGIGGNGSGGLDNTGRYLSCLSNYIAWGTTNYLLPDDGITKTWHIGFTISGGTWTGYVNGAQVFQTSFSAPSGAGTCSCVGGLLEGGYIRGMDTSMKIDSWAVYSGVLAAARFNAHYQAGLKPPDPPTYLYLGTGGRTLHSDPADGRRQVTVWASTPTPTQKGQLWLDKSGS